MSTAYITDPRFAVHTMAGHPEFAGRLTALQACLAESGLIERLMVLGSELISDHQVRLVHTADYVARLEATSRRSDVTMFGLDTYVTPRSYEIARLASGSVVALVDAVVNEQADNGLAAIRPPGHHATLSYGMGFCLLNNVAIAARHLQQAHDIQRVLIVDFDVHHGNGTQDVFWTDPTVLYISTHQSPLYPGTGAIDDVGSGLGRGTTLNIPMPSGVGDAGYARVYEEIVIPAARRFEPEFILVSAGFDAHWADPLANMSLSLAGYAQLSQILIDLSAELCAGRIVFVLEGGYNLDVLGNAWVNVTRALLGDGEVADPMGPSTRPERDITALISILKQYHNLT